MFLRSICSSSSGISFNVIYKANQKPIRVLTMRLSSLSKHVPCDHTATFGSPSSYQRIELISESRDQANPAFSCTVYSQRDTGSVVRCKLALIDRSLVGLDRHRLGLKMLFVFPKLIAELSSLELIPI